MLGEVPRGISCVYDLWAQYKGKRWETSMRRRRKMLVVSMVGGPICVVTPPNAFKVKRN